VVLKLGYFGEEIRNTLKVLKCGAGEGWKRSGRSIMCKTKKWYIESRRGGIGLYCSEDHMSLWVLWKLL
jgi:hypothetical protein